MSNTTEGAVTDVAAIARRRIAQVLVRSRGAPVTASDDVWPGAVEHYEEMCARWPEFRDERALVNDAFRAADNLISAFPTIASHLTEQGVTVS